MKSLFHVGLACVLGALTSCSDSDVADPAPTLDATQIGKDGGTVSTGDASVELPKGALSSSVKISVAASSVAVAPPAGYVLAGPAIAFTPHGLTFQVPVTLTLPYDSSSEQLAVLRLDDEDDKSWEVMNGGDFSDGSATLDVTTFSIYAVAAESGETQSMGGAGAGAGAGGAGSGEAGAPTVGGEAGAPAAGGAAGTGAGDLTWSCDRTDTDGNGLRICTDYFYPALIVELVGDKLMPGCPGPGDGILGEACDTSDAVAGCLAHDVDGIAGVTVTNWFYMGTKEELMNGVLCTEDGTEFVDPP